ncbi:MAG: AMP-binding protein [Gammaproteobacteria bacterium]|nr:AMP-binding protein [Gammaproteobacteria bacterium]
METFPSLFIQLTKTRSTDPAIRYKHHGLWKIWTWGDAESVVKELACGLAAKGVKPNEKVAIIGNNIPQLYFAMIAVQCLGAVAVPIHPDSNPQELVSLLNNCEAKLAMVQDQQQVDALLSVTGQCEYLSEVVYHDGRGMKQYDHTHLSSFEQIQETGKKFAQEHVSFFDDVTSKVTQDTDAFILYTAGTSGAPRGAIHSNGSLINTGLAFANQEKVNQQEQVLAFMPLSYSANALFTYTLWLLKGFTINCPESNETIMNDLREIGPTLLYAPPHFYKQLHAEITWRGQRSSTYWFDKWFAIATKNRQKFLDGKKLSFGDSLKWSLGQLLMYQPLKNVFGLSKLRKAYVGGDMLNSEVFNFLRSIGVHIKKTYGTTESAGFICVQSWEQLNTPAGEYILGKPFPGVELRKLDNGEIVFKGINAFKEYCNNPEATAAVKDSDGWVRTGDAGELDSIGALRITDRVDAIGKFTTGENFAPHLVENALKSSPYIQEAVAVGEGHDAIVAFIVIDGVTVGSWAEVNGVRFAGYKDLTKKEEVYDLVKKTVEDVNAHMGQIEGESCPRIKRFVVLHREFMVDQGEITRSRKVKRDVVMERFEALVNALYTSQGTAEIKEGDQVAELRIEST